MRSIRIASLLFSMAIILLLLFYYICVPQEESSLQARAGVLDLSGQDFHTNVFLLQGEWEFYHHTFLTPGGAEPSSSMRHYSAVPSSWSSQGFPRYGYASYRLLVKTGEDRLLGMLITDVAQAARVFVNGREVFARGVVAKSKEAYQQGVLTGYTFFETKNGQAEIVVWAANFDTPESGMISVFKIGDASVLFLRTAGNWILVAMVMGAIVMMGLYHLALYVFHARGSANLAFACLCFVCVGKFLLDTDGLLCYFLENVNGTVAFSIYLILFALHCYIIVWFSLAIFALEFWHKYRLYFLLYYSTALALAMVFQHSFFGIYKYHLFTIPILFGFIISGKKVLRKRKTIHMLYLIGLVLYLAGSYVGLHLALPLFIPNLMIDLFMVLSQSIILSFNYANAFHQVEETNKNLENIVSARTQEVLASKHVIKQMIRNISHDLQTPLTAMSNYLQLMTDQDMSLQAAQKEKYMQIIYQKHRGIERLVKKLLEVNSLDEGKIAYAMEWVYLDELLQAISDQHRAYLLTKGIDITLHTIPGLEVQVDKEKIWSVFDNVLYNAAKYTPAGGRITVVADAVGGGLLEMIITDTGCGIEEVHVPHIFELFYQAQKNAKKHEGQGGIGLYIAKTAIEGMGGTMYARSKVGEGTSIVLHLCCRFAKEACE